MTDTHVNASLNDEPIDDEIAEVLRDLKFPTNKDGIVDAARAQDELQVCAAERSLAGLVDDRLPWQRLKFLADIPAPLAADENAPARALVPDPGADALRAPSLVLGKVRKIGAMALGVWKM